MTKIYSSFEFVCGLGFLLIAPKALGIENVKGVSLAMLMRRLLLYLRMGAGCLPKEPTINEQSD